MKNPPKHEIVAYGKRRILEIYGNKVTEKQAKEMAEDLIEGIWSRGGGISKVEDIDSAITIIVRRWIESGYINRKE